HKVAMGISQVKLYYKLFNSSASLCQRALLHSSCCPFRIFDEVAQLCLRSEDIYDHH
ncbi:hypothetical protein GOP47_0004295, partial [Adiantum capillus-veneris]